MTSFVALRTGLLARRGFSTSACRYFTTAAAKMEMSEINQDSKCVPCEGIGGEMFGMNIIPGTARNEWNWVSNGNFSWPVFLLPQTTFFLSYWSGHQLKILTFFLGLLGAWCVAALSGEEATEKMKLVKGWSISDDSKSITKKLKLKNFVSALDYINRIGQVAEGQGHHPDLHITGYQYVQIDLMTHALDGLTDNDFIMAVCIDGLPVELSKKP